jgi:hypothetical protein
MKCGNALDWQPIYAYIHGSSNLIFLGQTKEESDVKET